MTQVWDSAIRPATKRLVLLALADSANDEGVCWPSVATVAAKAGASRRRTEEVLAELETEGLLSKRARFNDSNVYTLLLDNLPKTPRENCGTPREKVGDPPAKTAGPPREKVGTNRKRTPKEPTTPDADAPEQQGLDLPLPEPPEERPEEKTPTVNQRAVLLAQAHYERLGRMGNIPAWVKIIVPGLKAGYTDEQIDTGLAYIAAHNWTLTSERLANVVRGGPRRPSGSPIPPRSVPSGQSGRGPRLEV